MVKSRFKTYAYNLRSTLLTFNLVVGEQIATIKDLPWDRGDAKTKSERRYVPSVIKINAGEALKQP